MNDFNVFIDDLPLWSAPFGLKLLDILVFRKHITVLDLGCGEGFPIIEIAARFGISSRFYGLDPLESPLRRMHFKKKIYRLPTVQAVQGVAEQLPFCNQSIDLLVSNNGINNVTDLEQTLKECRRVMKPDGQMVISVNTEETMKEFYSLFRSILEAASLFGAVDKMKDQIEKKRPSFGVLEALLKTAGLTIRQVVEDDFTLKFSDGTTMLNHYLIRNFFLTGWKQVVNPDMIKPVFDLVETRLNAMACENGYISLTIPYMILDCCIDE